VIVKSKRGEVLSHRFPKLLIRRAMSSMKIAAILSFTSAHAITIGSKCNFGDREVASLVLLGAKATQLGVDCEGMCKEVGAYPNCNCPGFEGQPASSDDTRACIDKYCQDPSAPCPNDAFVGCVKENTKVSALQMPAVAGHTHSGLASLAQTVSMAKRAGAGDSKSCASKSVAFRALLQATSTQLGVDCEGMCKEVGAYPNCNCPGFEGQPASADDTRACIDKYCQDPSAPCPNDAFVGCVKENTKVSALQFDAIYAKVSKGLDSLFDTVRLAHNHTGTRNETKAEDEIEASNRTFEGYKKDWHNEYEHGRAPDWEESHSGSQTYNISGY